jgi:hypothetical protein
VASGAVRVPAADRAELDRLFAGTDPGVALGLGPNAAADQVRAQALAGIGRWRTAAADPLADPTMVEVCETAAWVLESIYGSVGA